MNSDLSPLSPENESFVQDALQHGIFRSRDELVNEAVGLLKKREKLRDDVNAGISQLERGEGIELDIEDIKARGLAWLAKQ